MRFAMIAAKMMGIAVLASLFLPSAGAQATAAKKPARKAKAANKAAAPAPPAAAAKKEEEVAPVSKRDPFQPLVGGRTEVGANLPPGKAGLVISTIRVDGAVRAPSGMIAVVSNPQQRVYFVREGDRLYDGDVEKISLDGVVFRENSKDAFGKPIQREVTKRIYASAGEQQ